MLPMCHATRDPPKTDPVRASDSVLGGGSSKVLAATRTARLRSVAPLGGGEDHSVGADIYLPRLGTFGLGEG